MQGVHPLLLSLSCALWTPGSQDVILLFSAVQMCVYVCVYSSQMVRIPITFINTTTTYNRLISVQIPAFIFSKLICF